jgi:hypothetical protein
MANKFNTYFAKTDLNISDSVLQTSKDPLSYIPENPNIPPLELHNIGPGAVPDITKSLEKSLFEVLTVLAPPYFT